VLSFSFAPVLIVDASAEQPNSHANEPTATIVRFMAAEGDNEI
jgi:hypothetical protein